MHSSRAMACALVIAALGVMLAIGTAWGARADIEIDSLRGLGSVYLIVQSPNADLAGAGFDKNVVKASVRKKLEGAGIKVISDSSDLKDNDAILLIAVATVMDPAGRFACSIDEQLIQVTSLARDSKTLVPATTWTSGIVAMVDGKGIKYLQERIDKLVNEFITDYRSVNLPNLPISGETKSS